MQYANADLIKKPAANAASTADEATELEYLHGSSAAQPTHLSRNQPERRATAKLDYYKKLAELQQMNLEFGRNIREAQQQARQTQETNGRLNDARGDSRKSNGNSHHKSGGETSAHPLTTAFHVATKTTGTVRPASSSFELPSLSKPLPESERVTASLDFNRLLELQRQYDELHSPSSAPLPATPANSRSKEAPAGAKDTGKLPATSAQAVALSIEDRLAVRLLESPAPRLPLRERTLNEERKLSPVQPEAVPLTTLPALSEPSARRQVSDLERRVSANPAAHYGVESIQALQHNKVETLAARQAQSFEVPSERVREALLDPTRIDPHLISLSDLNPRAAKYYDQVAVSLIAISYKRLLKRVLITSALHGEGRTSVALNLAGALARARQRVLVVDCDLLNPSVLRLLGLDAPVGLSEAVRRGLGPTAATLRVQPAAFNLMPMREKVSHSAELLASPRFHELIQICEADYDFLLFDSSPLLESPDANLLAGLTDATLMVIRPGYSTTQQMAKAVSLFNEKDICGVVLNRVGDQ